MVGLFSRCVLMLVCLIWFFLGIYHMITRHVPVFPITFHFLPRLTGPHSRAYVARV